MKILFTFLTEKKNLLWTNTKFVYLIFINKLSWYHPKITYENIIVQKDINRFFYTYILWIMGNCSDMINWILGCPILADCWVPFHSAVHLHNINFITFSNYNFLGTLGSKSLSGPFDLEISERIWPLCDSASAIKKSRHSCFSSMKPIHSAARPYVAPETTWWCTLLLF